MCSWYKLEFESYPALLNEVENQFEKNAGKVTSISFFCLISYSRSLQACSLGSLFLQDFRALQLLVNKSLLSELCRESHNNDVHCGSQVLPHNQNSVEKSKVNGNSFPSDFHVM